MPREAMSSTDLSQRTMTGAELLDLGDIGPCELIAGRVVFMSPTGGEHGHLELELGRLLGNFVAERRLGWVMTGEVGVYTRRGPDSVRGADVAFVSRARLGARPGRRFLSVAPELVVEILSPDDRPGDIRAKITEYFGIGVDRVWIVEPRNRVVFVHRSATESTRFGTGQSVPGEGVLEGFSLALDDLFAE